MNGDTYEGEATALAVREVREPAPPGLFTAMRPAEKVAYATEVAGVLKDVLVKRNLIKRIGTSDHVELEGWQTCASIVGVSAKIEWTRALEGGNGWESRAVVVTAQGIEVGAGEGMCSRDESTWKKRDDFALRAMSQTRAMSRALRGVLAWIVVLAGYKPTPASEMVDAPPSPSQPSPAPAGPTKREAEAARSNGGGACAECHAPAGKHATRCSRREAGDSSPQSAPAPAAVAEPTPEPPPVASAPQGGKPYAVEGLDRRRLMAVSHARAGALRDRFPTAPHEDAARHAFAIEVLGDPKKASSLSWSADDYSRVLDALRELPPDAEEETP